MVNDECYLKVNLENLLLTVLSLFLSSFLPFSSATGPLGWICHFHVMKGSVVNNIKLEKCKLQCMGLLLL
jgi:hypothetical protein